MSRPRITLEKQEQKVLYNLQAMISSDIQIIVCGSGVVRIGLALV